MKEIEELNYEDFNAGTLSEDIKAGRLVTHKDDGLLVVLSKNKEGQYLCHKKDELEATQKQNAKLYTVGEITQHVNFKFKIFNEKQLPTSIMNIKLPIDAPVSEIEQMGKAAFVKIGTLLLDGKKLESTQTLVDAGIKENTEVTSAMGAGIKYKEKRDQLVQDMSRSNETDDFRFVSLEVPIVSMTVHYSEDCYGLAGFTLNLADGTDSGLLGKEGVNEKKTKTLELINPTGFGTRHPDT